MLTPNILTFSAETQRMEEDIDIYEGDLRRRATWGKWRNEYLKSLRERHNTKCKGENKTLPVGNVVISQGDKHNKRLWRLRITEELFQGERRCNTY